MTNTDTRLNLIDQDEMRDALRQIAPAFTEEKFSEAVDEFAQIKKSVMRHRRKVALRASKRRVLH